MNEKELAEFKELWNKLGMTPWATKDYSLLLSKMLKTEGDAMATATKTEAAKKKPAVQNTAEVYGVLTENAETKTTLEGSVHRFLVCTCPACYEYGSVRINIPCVCSRDSDLEELLTKNREVHGTGYIGNDSLGRGTLVITRIEVSAHGIPSFDLPAPEDF